jgi:NAD(P)-dependent dehydrogenase (short-subunit alcohol dehydrogenase family)
VQRDELGGDQGRASERQPCGHVACFGEIGGLQHQHGARLLRTPCLGEAAGGQAMYDPADLACCAGIEKIRRRIEAESGPIDILVANAAQTSLTADCQTWKAT